MILKRINGSIIDEGEDIKTLVERNKHNLYGSDLLEFDLSGLDLSGVNLSGSNFCSTNLTDANLSGSHLTGTFFYKTNLTRALFFEAMRGEYILKKAPLSILTFHYNVLIFDAHMEIGCESHSFEEWEAFTDEEILRMDGEKAIRFWKTHKGHLLGLCKTRGEV